MVQKLQAYIVSGYTLTNALT